MKKMTLAELKRYYKIPEDEKIYAHEISPRLNAQCKVLVKTFKGGEVLVNGIIRDVFNRVITVELIEQHRLSPFKKYAQIWFDRDKIYTIEKEELKQLRLFP